MLCKKPPQNLVACRNRYFMLMDLRFSWSWLGLDGLGWAELPTSVGLKSSPSVSYPSWTPKLPKAYSSHVKGQSTRI